MVKVSITATHDGGNVEFVSHSEPVVLTTTPDDDRRNDDGVVEVAITVTVRIRRDVHTELENVGHMQYFSFRSFVSGLVPPEPQPAAAAAVDDDDDAGGGPTIVVPSASVVVVTYVIANASDASFPDAWPGSTVCYNSHGIDSSYDDRWRRNLTTEYDVDDSGALTWTHVHEMNGSTYFSYWPPYGYDRHLRLISDCTSRMRSGRVGGTYNPAIESIGTSLDGREIECLSVGNGKLNAWIQHRQHPGETMAEFYAEGLLHRLFGVGEENGDIDDATRTLLEGYRLHVIPNVNPDGSVLGHLRTNAAGANLNREWADTNVEGYQYAAPTSHRSPEVLAILRRMDEIGCDFFLDVHGDETIPYVFFSGCAKTPVWGDRIRSLHGYFVEGYIRANPDVQKVYGYPPPLSEENALDGMTRATKHVSNRFNCLGLTLEIPYKDCATNPDPEVGLGLERCKRLGSNLVEALVRVHPYLRAEGDFWKAFSEEDEYIVPTDRFPGRQRG